MGQSERDRPVLFFDPAGKLRYEIAFFDLPFEEKEKIKRESRVYYKAWERISSRFGKENSAIALADAICFLPINVGFDALTLYQVRGDQLHGEYTFNSEVTEEHYTKMLNSFRDMPLEISSATTIPGKVVLDQRTFMKTNELSENQVLVLNIPDAHELPEPYRTGTRNFEEQFPYTVGPILTISIVLRKKLYGVMQMLCLVSNENKKKMDKSKLSAKLRPFSPRDV